MKGNDRTIVETTLPDGKWVSTVRLPMDHGFGGDPLWYETMVFPKEDEWIDLDCERYGTEEEARAGHEAMVAKWSQPGRPEEARP